MKAVEKRNDGLARLLGRGSKPKARLTFFEKISKRILKYKRKRIQKAIQDYDPAIHFLSKERAFTCSQELLNRDTYSKNKFPYRYEFTKRKNN